MSFVHLHVHSQYSLLHGAIRIPSLLTKVKSYGMDSIALTDQGNLFGLFEFYQAAKSLEIKPIFGINAYVTHGDRRDKSHQFPTYQLILLAKDQEGLQNLFRLSTLSYFEGFYYKPRMDREILKRYSKGLVALSGGFHAGPMRALMDGRHEKAKELIEEYQNIFGMENYYVEIIRTGNAERDRPYQALSEMAKGLGAPLVATNPTFYLEKVEAKAHDALLCIGMGKTLDDPNRMRFQTQEHYLKSPEEMEELFRDLPEALENTHRIAHACNVTFTLGQYLMPKYELPKGETLDAGLRRLSFEGLEERWPQITSFYERRNQPMNGLKEQYAQRLDHELKTIAEMGFSGYFLIVQDFINHAKASGIPVGPGRGSAAGSLVAYATKITDIDPIPYALLFERFLNPERISMPDIDVDFCQDGRDHVIAYVAKKYGDASEGVENTRVAQITTFGKMQARAVIRDVGRVMNLPYGDVDRIAKLVPNVLNISLEEAFAQEPKFEELRKQDSKIDELLTIALHLEGLTRHASVHAAGVVISDENPLVQHLPLYKGQHDEVVTQWDMKGVEKIGLIKFDFLGLKTLTLMKRAVKMIAKSTGSEMDLLTLDMNDERVFELLSRGDTKGVFQLESSGMREIVVKLKPSSFEDIVALVALYRPGPLGSGMVDDFINRKHGRTPIHYDLPELEPILKDTYGVILYQEQVMQIASVLADYSLGEADLLRRAMGKKIASEMDQQERRFLDGCKKNKIPDGKAKKIFDLMAKFAGYGFNKSHSAAYALISYQTAFLKTHHPAEFMAASMSIDRNNTDRVVLLLSDARAQGIEVLPPDVNESQMDFSVRDGKIRFGLAAVKNVGEGAIEAIVEARKHKGAFSDLFDFCSRVDLKRVNKRVVEALIKCGAFDSSGGRRSQMMASLEKAMEAAHQIHRDRVSGQTSLFGSILEDVPITGRFEDVPDWEEAERLKFEKESVGFYVTGHPLLKYVDTLSKFSNADIAQLTQVRDKSTARIGGMVSSLKEITTKKGDRMAFMTLEDLTGTVECVVFSDIYQEKSELLKLDEPVFVMGKVDIAEDQAKIIVEKVGLLSQASEMFSGKMHIILNLNQMDEVTLNKLRTILQNHTGDCPALLHLQIPGRSETILSLPKDYSVNPSSEFVSKIEEEWGDRIRLRFS